jgi:hypothetical protein
VGDHGQLEIRGYEAVTAAGADSAGRMMVVAAALVGGASVVVESSFSARNFFRRATEVGATLAYGVGATAVRKRDAIRRRGESVSSVEFEAQLEATKRSRDLDRSGRRRTATQRGARLREDQVGSGLGHPVVAD